MVERIKNKKGFTIIEVMVVIALIGILAAVLVPQFGGVKDRAKDAGMLTNAKMVEAFVASAIDGYKSGESDKFAEAIQEQFSGTNKLTNPYTLEADDDNIVVAEGAASPTGDEYAATGAAGTVQVVVAKNLSAVYINGFNNQSVEIQATRRKLTK